MVLVLSVPGQSFTQSSRNSLIDVSDNRRHFIYRDYKPFFWQGDTEWELFHLFSIQEAKAFLLERKKQGFNVIQVMTTGVFPGSDIMKGVKRAGYWSCLAGGFYSYGHRDNWMAPLKWRNWYRSEGAMQMKIMGDIFRSLEWWKLVPDESVFIDSVSGNVTARSKDGDWIITYLTNMNPLTLKLNTITALKKVTAWWISPVTGKRKKIGTYDTSGNQIFLPPKNWRDAVLLIAK